MILRIIDKKEYLSIVESRPDLSLKDIDLSQYSDYYYLLEHINQNLAICGIQDQKNSIRQVNGLIALEKGYGKKLLLAIIAKYLRLSCTINLYDKFYSKLGFEKYLQIDDYIECMKFD